MTRTPAHVRGRRLAATAAIVAAGLLLVPASALAAGQPAHVDGGSGLAVSFALFGIPSVSSILRSIANDLFAVLAGAFLPSWLREAPADTLRWLIALPNPADAAQWPTMRHLEQDTTSVAVAFLPLTLAIATVRYTASGVSGGVHHPAESLGRFFAAAGGLVIYPWAFQNAVAAVNVTTSTLISFADIDHGLQRALTLMFAGGVAFGVTGPLVAVLVIAAIFLAVALIIVKVGVLVLFAVLFVAGPLTLAGYPIPELHGAWRLWAGLLTAAAMIPIGWCVIFAVAGAISADITHIGTPAAIGTRTVGFFAGLLTFFLAFRWPFFLISRVRGVLGGGGLGADGSGNGRGGGGSGGGASVGARVQQGKLALLAAGAGAGSGVSRVGAAVGMPTGGLAGAAGRRLATSASRAAGTPLGLRGQQTLSATWQAVRHRSADTARAARAAGVAGAAGGHRARAAEVGPSSTAAAGAGGAAPRRAGRAHAERASGATPAAGTESAARAQRSQQPGAQTSATDKLSNPPARATGATPAGHSAPQSSSQARAAAAGATTARASAAAAAADQSPTPAPVPAPRASASATPRGPRPPASKPAKPSARGSRQAPVEPVRDGERPASGGRGRS